MSISFDLDEDVTYPHVLSHLLTYFLSECAFLCVLVRWCVYVEARTLSELGCSPIDRGFKDFQDFGAAVSPQGRFLRCLNRGLSRIKGLHGFKTCWLFQLLCC